ncbi:MAG: hypothetical protein DME22_08940 [Verrucomicrobia bacterium]|nr:MAG: hypothetical protein DME22_08940 [Verrucomicrobiota bacterium]PYJ93301.1 MAG: hypothetical protein DME23_26285 [Verrucomicrobiota bacterium]
MRPDYIARTPLRRNVFSSPQDANRAGGSAGAFAGHHETNSIIEARAQMSKETAPNSARGAHPLQRAKRKQAGYFQRPLTADGEAG